MKQRDSVVAASASITLRTARSRSNPYATFNGAMGSTAPRVGVKIDVEASDGDDGFELADVLGETVKDASREYREDQDD